MLLKFFKLFIVFILLSTFGFLYFTFDPINTLFFPKCPLFTSTGIYCPGCGSQRATHALLHFDLINVLKSNLLFLPIILLIMYHLGIRITNRILETNYRSILDNSKAPIVVLVIVLLYWLLRNLAFFSFLAP
jgi:hypothetical protein